MTAKLKETPLAVFGNAALHNSLPASIRGAAKKNDEAGLTTVAATTSLPSPAVPLSSSPSTTSSVTVAVAAYEDEVETASFSNDHAPSSDGCPIPSFPSAPAVTSSDDSGQGPRLGFLSHMPSFLGCLAACFGWRLASFRLSENGEMRFSLQHPFDTRVRATVTAFPDAFDLSTEAAPPVKVNDVAMDLHECAAHLHTLLQRSCAQEVDASAPLPAAPSTLPPLNSPVIQLPPAPSLAGRALAAQRRAYKRARSRSPSRPSRSFPPATAGASPTRPFEPPPPPSGPSSTDKSAVHSTAVDGNATSESPEASSSPALERHGTRTPPPPDGPRSAGETADAPRRKQRVRRATTAATPPPPPLASTSSSPTSNTNASAVVKKESAPSQSSLEELPDQETESLDDEPRAFAYLTTAVAAASADVPETDEADAVCPLPRPTAPRAASTKSTSSTAAVPSAATKTTLTTAAETSPSRSRRSTAAALTASSANAAAARETNTAVSAAHPPGGSASLTVLHGAVKRSFFMPYMASLGTTAAASHHSAANSSVPPADERRGEGRNGLNSTQTGAFRGLDGWTAASSRCWLAHTHAVSRDFDTSAAAHRLCPYTCDRPPATDSSTTERHSTAEQKVHDDNGMGSGCTAAVAAAAVRATLHQRWRQRSSLWSQMEDSLRLSVGSGRLRGDALEAGVQALQAGEEELQQYGGADNLPEETAYEDGHDEELAATCEAPLCGFPRMPPRPLLPVSGKTVLEAQARISAAEEAEAEAGKHRGGPSNGDGDGQSPRYVVYPGGIPAADRIVIDRTYTTRGSFLVAGSPFTSAGEENDPVKGEETREECLPPPLLPALLANPHEDVHYHIYKRFLTRDMREALEAEGTLAIGPDGIGPVNGVKEAAAGNGKGSAVSPVRVQQRKQQQKSSRPSAPHRSVADTNNNDDDDADDAEANDDDDGDGEERGDSVVGKARYAFVPTAVKVQAGSDGGGGGGAEPMSSANIDYILRYRTAIPRIPMPDVESRYEP